MGLEFRVKGSKVYRVLGLEFRVVVLGSRF